MDLTKKLLIFFVIILSLINTTMNSPTIQGWLNGESADFSMGDILLIVVIIIGAFVTIFGLAIWLQNTFNLTDDEDDETTRTSDHKDSDHTKK
ncbi:hypothetical protein ACFFLZ_12210 [Photobacterium aphoticum]|uniref:Uncharacterized protein n=1 Tax=Photobacterium aphoticum TaxID=754436 RepID=A0A0J1GP37_9GAMM|nr:hypothetical protein [Photobacterium aphoticum]KLV01538.1 hypothetical protein ABT58_07125 [Photobacterium aphoticum]PSU54906.1 hypothetical protein C9I90_18450 [Photobacterium aphoticum]GHA43246.1 hypothetical protein GCM10007086_15950 [Photobacterium aphoticum]